MKVSFIGNSAKITDDNTIKNIDKIKNNLDLNDPVHALFYQFVYNANVLQNDKINENGVDSLICIIKTDFINCMKDAKIELCVDDLKYLDEILFELVKSSIISLLNIVHPYYKNNGLQIKNNTLDDLVQSYFIQIKNIINNVIDILDYSYINFTRVYDTVDKIFKLYTI